MTLGIARIIPWRWDLKEGLIYCEAQKILDHMNFYKGEELYSPSRYYQGVRIFPKDTPGRLRTYAPCT